MPPTSSYLFLNGLRFHYLNWGGAGRPLVLLHGLASSARIWDRVAPRLAEHFRVLALDQRSHGLTDPAEAGWDFASITRDLHAFMEALALERPLLVGHSWGASTVLSYAAGLVLVDGGLFSLSEAPGMTWEKAEALLRPPDLDGMPVEQFLGRLRGWLGDRYSDEIADLILANFRVDEDERIFRRLPIPHHMQIARAIYEKKAFDLFSRVRCPILLCPAAEPPADERAAQFLSLKRAGVAQAEAAAAEIRTVWFEATPHDIPLFRPAELADAIVAFGAPLTG
jgi:pimeloyl-ACP methyl ester carboxylesterase